MNDSLFGVKRNASRPIVDLKIGQIKAKPKTLTLPVTSLLCFSIKPAWKVGIPLFILDVWLMDNLYSYSPVLKIADLQAHATHCELVAILSWDTVV